MVVVVSIVFFNHTMVSIVLPSVIKTLLYEISDKSLTTDKIALLFVISNKSLSVEEEKKQLCQSNSKH